MTVTASRSALLRDPLALGASVGAAWLLVAVVDPHESGRYPVCPTLSILGVYCPLCGGLRAANDLAHGDAAGAWDMNPLVTLALPVAVLLWMRWLVQRARGSTRSLVDASARTWWIALVALLVFAVVRNLPWGSALAP